MSGDDIRQELRRMEVLLRSGLFAMIRKRYAESQTRFETPTG